MAKRYLITSALLYANGVIHFGHLAGAFLPADAYARFRRLMGDDVLYISGSDEYGFAITMSAELAKRSPLEHVNYYHELNKKLFARLNIAFDHYSRTTWPGHKAPVQQFFLDLLEGGYIEKRETEQLYSEKDHKFLADRYVTGTCPACKKEGARGDECPHCGASFEATDLLQPRSKATGAPLTLKKTTHWFLRFDLFKDKLLKWLATKHWKPNVVNFVEGYIRDLKPRAITRDSDWGISIPLENTEGKVLYVWFDAPIGYISATQEWAQINGHPEAWKPFWLDPDTQLVHFIGKDNIPFHAIFFPAMCMGQNTPYKLVDDIPANEFLNLEGKQFSKSAGWTIDMEEFLANFSSDQIRYALAANAPETSDTEFTWSDFQMRCNAELVGKFGNLVNRVLVFIKKHCRSKVPPKEALEAVDHTFLQEMQVLVDKAKQSYEGFSLRKAAGCFIELATLGNVYFDTKKPWVDAKSPETHSRMQTTMALCLDCLHYLAFVSLPLIPETAWELLQMLGNTTPLKDLRWSVLQPLLPGQALQEPRILFQKVEDMTIAQELAKLHSLPR
ncbi:MAG: methionine--tRNA ligase [Chlamydiae bacterium]|nr:methionine--tRNA ligase [Chlamydiota bacterium]